MSPAGRPRCARGGHFVTPAGLRAEHPLVANTVSADQREEQANAGVSHEGTAAREGRLSRGTAIALLLFLTACAPPRGSQVTIGAKNFTESVVLGELMAQEIEAVDAAQGRPQEKVARRFYLAGSYLCHQALISGRIDGYAEYTGTALTAILKQPLPPAAERGQVFATVKRLYAQRFHVTVEPALGFNDTFALVMRSADARQLGVSKISDLKSHPGLRLGVGYEFQSRPDGLVGLEKAYGLSFAQPRVMDLGLLYRAMASNQVDVVAGNSTDGPIRALGLTVLDDDLHYFPPYEAVPLISDEALRLHPEIGLAMERLAGKVAAAEMQGMNDAVDGRHEDVAEVVRAFRSSKGL